MHWLTIIIFIASLSTVGAAQTKKSSPTKPPVQSVTIQNAVTDEGKLVVLRSDGTWSYAQVETAKPTAPIQTVNQKATRAIEDLRTLSSSSLVEITIKYDEFKDNTFVGTIALPIVVDKDASMKIMLGFQFSGKVLKGEPNFVGVTFFSSSKDWQFLKHNDLTFLSNGERIGLGKAVSDGKVEIGYVKETLIYPMRLSDLSKLAKAGVIKFQIGSAEGIFAELNHEAVKMLYSLASLQ